MVAVIGGGGFESTDFGFLLAGARSLKETMEALLVSVERFLHVVKSQGGGDLAARRHVP